MKTKRPDTGDIVGLTQRKLSLDPRSWLSSLIALFTKSRYTHTGTLIVNDGFVYVCEALGRGVKLNNWEQPSNREVIYKTPKKRYTKAEKEELQLAAGKFIVSRTKYDFMGLIYQAVLSLTGKWIGPKEPRSEKRLYCSELTALLSNEVRPNTFKAPHSTNPNDVVDNRFYVEYKLKV